VPLGVSGARVLGRNTYQKVRQTQGSKMGRREAVTWL